MSDLGGLIVVPTIRVATHPDGRLVMPRKFVDGMLQNVKLWQGPVSAVIEPADRPDNNLDLESFDPAELPFAVSATRFDSPEFADKLRGARVVLASLDWRQTHVAKLCADLGIACVYIAEVNFTTTRQMILAETANPILIARRILWSYQNVKKCKVALKAATGLQCNGTPTYHDYRALNPRTLLYFDNRSDSSLIASEEEIRLRSRHLAGGGPIRLAFSGRLIRIKGVDHFPAMADELRRLGQPFTLDIFGGGDLLEPVRARVEALGLADRVKFRGVLNFRTALMPEISRNVDLFVCPHPQGDPSTTYIETMACGVPIVGYANQAFEGIVEQSGVGWVVPIGRPKQLARKIVAIAKDPAGLERAALGARQFALKHTFDRVFQSRIDHLAECASA